MGVAGFIGMKLLLYWCCFPVAELCEISVGDAAGVWWTGWAWAAERWPDGSAQPRAFCRGARLILPTASFWIYWQCYSGGFALGGFSFSHNQHIHFFPLHSQIPRVSNYHFKITACPSFCIISACLHSSSTPVLQMQHQLIVFSVV